MSLHEVLRVSLHGFMKVFSFMYIWVQVSVGCNIFRCACLYIKSGALILIWRSAEYFREILSFYIGPLTSMHYFDWTWPEVHLINWYISRMGAVLMFMINLDWMEWLCLSKDSWSLLMTRCCYFWLVDVWSYLAFLRCFYVFGVLQLCLQLSWSQGRSCFV